MTSVIRMPISRHNSSNEEDLIHVEQVTDITIFQAGRLHAYKTELSLSEDGSTKTNPRKNLVVFS